MYVKFLHHLERSNATRSWQEVDHFEPSRFPSVFTHVISLSQTWRLTETGNVPVPNADLASAILLRRGPGQGRDHEEDDLSVQQVNQRHVLGWFLITRLAL